MKTNIFDLTTVELQEIAESLEKKIEEGLKKDSMEIRALPTHINPQEEIPDGKVLVLDWGGTNFRAAIVEYKNGKPEITKGPVKRLLDAETTAGFKRDDLFREMASTISELNPDESVTRVGFCFSYPTASRLNGDAILLGWTKGMDIPDMIGKPIGESFIQYLNAHKGIEATFKDIKVINDTVACLFAGLKETGYDSYIGLIVGTGTNMACLMPLDKITKLGSSNTAVIPVNLESGNFTPPYLTVTDDLVDAVSDNKGRQRFEKAISGGYIGRVFRTVFMHEKIKYNFDGGDLACMLNSPEKHPDQHVEVAQWIYDRSAKLVASSLAGLVDVIVAQDSDIKKICLAADGSVFWGKDKSGKTYYKDLVARELDALLPKGVEVTIIDEMSDPNLIGAAIAALS